MNGRTRDEPVWTLAQVDAFAEDAHRGQTRNTGDETAPDVPYIVHPRAVVAILRDEHPDKSLHADWIAATALLLDVLEDCDVHPDTLTTLFGAEICAAVRALSKQMRAVEGAVKSDEQYWKVLAQSPLVLRQIKGADRIDNLRSCLRWPRERLARKDLSETPAQLLPMLVDDPWLYTTLAGLLIELRRAYP